MTQSPEASKHVHLFGEVELVEARVGGDWDAVRGLLGGKSANLADMTRLEAPVPPGFTVTTEGCNAFLAASEEFPPGTWEQELEAIEAIEKATGKKFGDRPPIPQFNLDATPSRRNEA